MQKQKKFQIDVEDPYMLHSELQFPGLVVLEIFAHWCDVCKSIDPIFRNHFVDLATRKLKFVRVQHAFVPWLRRYHGRCRPTFLFFVGGSLKEIVEGIDTPRLDALIPQLAPEDEVPLEKFVPEDCFPELNSDEIYQQYTARYEELERERAIAIEAGTEADVDPRGEYNSLVKEFEQSSSYRWQRTLLDHLTTKMSHNYLQKEVQREPVWKRVSLLHNSLQSNKNQLLLLMQQLVTSLSQLQ